MNKNFLNVKNLNFSHIKYGFFTRIGGKSKNNFSSLNCSISSGDKITTVKKNIKTASKMIISNNQNLKLVKQLHSNKIIEISKNNFNSELKGDGLITKDFSIALGVLTADCAPIFVFDKKKNFICCLHAGWKGALLNISKKSINLIKKKYHKNLNDLVVIIGPCLAKNNFEVSSIFKKKFIKSNIKYKKFFLKKNNKKYLFDMRGLINYQFKEMGIKKILNSKHDTYKNEKLFFSHRRSNHKNLTETGRMINIVSFA